jgi:hypothetical protein
VIRSLNAALLIGIVSGTYSSIFNAAPLLVVWERLAGRKGTISSVGGGGVSARQPALAGGGAFSRSRRSTTRTPETPARTAPRRRPEPTAPERRQLRARRPPARPASPRRRVLRAASAGCKPRRRRSGRTETPARERLSQAFS